MIRYEKQNKILLKPTELVLDNNGKQNVADYLTNFICNTSVTVDKIEKDLLATQHRIAKELFDWEEIGERLKSCQDYHFNFSQFFQVSDKI